ncbi:hypothetical protein [Bacillus sp. B15-48]|uniref:hypothetical protein n=1 Tax=Bacillus sp. B15-48 TaxID=1548601 RepID=UPI00193FFB00|nr:hypothetical protein [Bacillus sp. B15-48]MBM4760945.1 hypothetical protein [Bacillus sp. B15-48]
MWLDLVFIGIFLAGVYYLVRYRLNLKMAAELSTQAVFPRSKEEFSSILVPAEWKEMTSLTKETKSYRLAHWGTMIVLGLLIVLIGIAMFTDWFDASLFSFTYFFFLILNSIRHPNNFFILPRGVIFQSRYYRYEQIKSFKVEEIIRWHELYGLNDRVNFGFKLTLNVKRSFPVVHFVVIEDEENVKKVITLLEKNGVQRVGMAEAEKVASNNK